jgi:hypothetical protein
MNTTFTEQDSMAVINEMIDRARNNFGSNMNAVIFWGYFIAALAIGNFVLLHVFSNNPHAYYVWLLTIPGWIVSFFIERHTNRRAVVKTHIDKIIHSVWLAFGISVFVFMAIIMAFVAMTGDAKPTVLITPVILIMMGMSEFVTACTCRNRWMKWSAAMFWVAAVLCVVPCAWHVADGHAVGELHQSSQFLILAVCMLLGFVVPGHIINRKRKCSHV